MGKRHELIHEMELLFRNVFRQLRQEIHEVLNAELSPNEFMTLRMLKDGGPQKVTDISKHLNVSASHITAVTDVLISKDYVERKRSEQDRRIVEIIITTAGIAAFERMEQKKQEYFFERFQQFTDEEIKIIITLFEKIDRTK
ncbi:MarR family transcriptional regulator [Bacillus sp. CGMCC 1.16541]|uniref:MarR family winged helix-turn-helix transcriptional regulator n=1 Tax=Bacillus sp. CGMCC 1.16541 TaxID=2185143 RepID=UPI000D73A4FA|nr:MarR family transcriptional regulator [Bacillus sp. CGMCC 1.16541]